jgi:hypothetical protein
MSRVITHIRNRSPIVVTDGTVIVDITKPSATPVHVSVFLAASGPAKTVTIVNTSPKLSNVRVKVISVPATRANRVPADGDVSKLKVQFTRLLKIGTTETYHYISQTRGWTRPFRPTPSTPVLGSGIGAEALPEGIVAFNDPSAYSTPFTTQITFVNYTCTLLNSVVFYQIEDPVGNLATLSPWPSINTSCQAELASYTFSVPYCGISSGTLQFDPASTSSGTTAAWDPDFTYTFWYTDAVGNDGQIVCYATAFNYNYTLNQPNSVTFMVANTVDNLMYGNYFPDADTQADVAALIVNKTSPALNGATVVSFYVPGSTWTTIQYNTPSQSNDTSDHTLQGNRTSICGFDSANPVTALWKGYCTFEPPVQNVTIVGPGATSLVMYVNVRLANGSVVMYNAQLVKYTPYQLTGVWPNLSTSYPGCYFTTFEITIEGPVNPQ